MRLLLWSRSTAFQTGRLIFLSVSKTAARWYNPRRSSPHSVSRYVFYSPEFYSEKSVAVLVLWATLWAFPSAGKMQESSSLGPPVKTDSSNGGEASILKFLVGAWLSWEFWDRETLLKGRSWFPVRVDFSGSVDSSIFTWSRGLFSMSSSRVDEWGPIGVCDLDIVGRLVSGFF